MSAVSQFTEIYMQIVNAAAGTLQTTMTDNLFEDLQEEAIHRVYSYPAQPEYKKRRRYKIADKSNFDVQFNVQMDYLEMTLKNVTKLQNGEPDEVTIVETGDPAYNQPGPMMYDRHFMDQGLMLYLATGADYDLAEGLRNAGFTVE